ncbi:MAG: TetR/AcrR family transcriptional regulator [Spirochaetaceae bacterium]|jgi:AcrR family transcriptional regulator|nr:TetR/AcrR family transcriptional regulator [Spirochaetaceae bacterium]
MTKNEILQTAFKVWGKTLYQTTSLTDLASELGVTKQALYRHFKTKDLLLKAMGEAVNDRFADFIRADYEACLNMDNLAEIELRLARVTSEYYMKNRSDFLFMMIYLFGSSEPELNQSEQLRVRGISIPALSDVNESLVYPSDFRLAMTTVMFMVATFHSHTEGNGDDKGSSHEVISTYLDMLNAHIQSGLGLSVSHFTEETFLRLEEAVRDCGLDPVEDESHQKLLNAVASAVAVAGPWDVSMGMVAQRSGLSKSSLYSHFENREEMIKELFLTEIGRIASYAEKCSLLSAVPEEQLYLAIIGIVVFLREKSDVIHVLDRLKTRRANFKKRHCGKTKPPSPIYKNFSKIRRPDGSLLVNERNTEWILFLIVNVLQRRPADMDYLSIPNESFRALFNFIARGIKNAPVKYFHASSVCHNRNKNSNE